MKTTMSVAEFARRMGIKEPGLLQRQKLKKHLSNWLVAYEFIAGMEASPKSVEIVSQMLLIELSESARPHVLERLYMRYSNLRREMETAMLHKACPALQEISAKKAA